VGDTSVAVEREAKRLNARIDYPELSGPVRTQSVLAVDTSSLDGVRPIDVRVHEGRARLNVARVKAS
jgi:hypothetical protein